ncbi:MAG TPA: RES family NAD+ phosphorylase [Thermoanaerobaculia bacterium]|nr:RES family NAD+ phosphorylase [Thermoanaerobaculia bacterium]
MLTAWRITKSEYAADAFSGDGAALYAGRWHSEGIRIVYTAETISLATLEILVHLHDRRRIPGYVIIPCYFPEAVVEELDATKLPSNWAAAISPPDLRRFGDQWANHRVSAVLKIPSAVTQVELNYLLNPEHPDFRSVDIGEPRSFHLDVRLYT